MALARFDSSADSNAVERGDHNAACVRQAHSGDGQVTRQEPTPSTASEGHTLDQA